MSQRIYRAHLIHFAYALSVRNYSPDFVRFKRLPIREDATTVSRVRHCW